MKPEKIFKRYDIRGRYPEELNEEFAEELGRAVATFADGEAVVSRDNKDSSASLKEAMISGMVESGAEVVDVGSGPTDYAAWCGRELDAVSVQVTSSHMPLDFNGFKLMYPDGNGFVNEDLNKVKEIFRSRDFDSGTGKTRKRNLFDRYRDEMKDFALDYVEEEKKIVYESMGGTGGFLPELLRELGHQVVDISEQNRPYMDPPNPKPEKLDRLEQAFKSEDADLGISNDLDADRVTFYWDGRFLKGDEVFCILAQLVEGPVTASVDTSKALEEFADVNYTRVGDPFVMEEALESGSKLAGEPNGHYSFTDFVPYNSGTLAALIFAGLNIRRRMERIPEIGSERISVETMDKHGVIEELKKQKEVISELDGVKFRERGADVLVRPSGSSPKVRIIVHSRDEPEEIAESVAEEVERIK